MTRVSVFGLALAVIYIAIATYIVHDDRTHTSGGWISLHGFSSYLVTLPVSAFFEVVLGNKLNFRSNFDMSLAVGISAALIYLLGAGIGFAFKWIFSTGQHVAR